MKTSRRSFFSLVAGAAAIAAAVRVKPAEAARVPITGASLPLSHSAMTVVDVYPSHANASARTDFKFARGLLVDDGSGLYRFVADGDGYLYRVDSATGRSILYSARASIKPSDIIVLD